MSEPPVESRGPSPLRVGGLALVGAGAVAALIGLASLLPGAGSPAPAAAPAPSASEAPAAPSAAPTTAANANSAVPVPSFSAAPTSAVAAPPVAPAPAAGTGGAANGGAVAKAPVRVYNNSTISGLAARAASDFRADGWQVSQIANYPSGVIASSTVYYRPGTGEQGAASSLGSQFGLRVEPRFQGIDDATPGLIVIVTNDYQKR